VQEKPVLESASLLFIQSFRAVCEKVQSIAWHGYAVLAAGSIRTPNRRLLSMSDNRVPKMAMTIRTFVPKTEESFDAINQAREWLRAKGYNIGSMSGDEPIGLSKRYKMISKWYNLSTEDRALLDGVLESEDFRNGKVTLKLFSVEHEVVNA